MRKFIPKHLALWHIVVPFLALSNVAFLSHNFFSWLATLGFFLFTPGYLLLRRLHITSKFGWAVLSLSVGLSLSLLTITGLILNSLHGFGYDRPLSTLPIFVAIDLLTLILLVINTKQEIHPRLPKFSLSIEETLFGIVFTILPFLAVGGAMRLNNGASNILTMVLMGLIGALFIVMTLRPGLKRIYPYAIFMTALSILFCISLRGWYVTGHDIHHEYSVFNIAMVHAYWNPLTNSGDPYNACLSITILPTLLAKITDITPIYIFKVVFQIIFAALVPAIYLFAKKFTTEKKALIGIFAFMTFPTFTNDLPFLNRQEIAFGYFILLLLVNFMNLSRKVKTFLTALLFLSIVLSHYSTSYATLGILLVAMLIYKLLVRFSKCPQKDYVLPMMRLPIVLMALLATFVWNVQVTASSSNLTNTLSSTIKGIFSSDSESSNFGHYNLLSKSKPSTPEEQFAKQIAGRNIAATYASPAEIPITPLGHAISKVVSVEKLNTTTHTLIAKILQLLVVVGTVVLFIRYLRKTPSSREIYYLALSLSCIGALIVFTFFPELSIGYDVTRLFQQSMMVLWLPVILASEFIFSWSKRLRLTLSASLLVFLYFNLAGFIPQLTGGFLPQLSLNNSGLYYDYFYAHKSDIVASDWLADNRQTYLNVFMDTNSAAQALKYSVATGLLSGAPQGYYYTDYTNNNSKIYRTFSSSGFVEYNNPTLLDGKGLIYSDGKSQIYYKLSYP